MLHNSKEIGKSLQQIRSNIHHKWGSSSTYTSTSTTCGAGAKSSVSDAGKANPPKFLGDLTEALLGAVFVDSHQYLPSVFQSFVVLAGSYLPTQSDLWDFGLSEQSSDHTAGQRPLQSRQK